VRQAYLNDMIHSKQRATVLSFDSLFGSLGGVDCRPSRNSALGLPGAERFAGMPVVEAQRDPDEEEDRSNEDSGLEERLVLEGEGDPACTEETAAEAGEPEVETMWNSRGRGLFALNVPAKHEKSMQGVRTHRPGTVLS